MTNNDRVSELYQGKIWDNERQHSCRRRIHWLCSHVDGPKVLDVGCSQGITSIILGREGYTVTGIDIEQPSLEYARTLLAQEPEQVGRQVTFSCVDATDMPFEDGTFDSALIGEVIEHLVHPARLLREVSRVVKDVGQIAISTPLGLHSYPDHKQTFYITDFLELVERHFTVLSVKLIDKTILCLAENTPATVPLYRQPERFRALIRNLESESRNFEAQTRQLLEDWKARNEKLSKAQKDTHRAYQELLSEKQKSSEQFQKEIRTLSERLALEHQRAATVASELQAKESEAETISRKLSDLQESLLAESKISAAAIEKAKCLEAELQQSDERIKKLQDDIQQRSGQLEQITQILDDELKNKEFIQQDLAQKSDYIARLEALVQTEQEKTRQAHKSLQKFSAAAEEQGKKLLKLEQELSSIKGARSYRWVTKINKLLRKLRLRRPASAKATAPTESTARTQARIVTTTEHKPPKAVPSEGGVCVAAILDEFSHACFEPECNLVTFRPDNWRQKLETQDVDLLLVESAWHGNDDAWQYRVASYKHNMGDELSDLLTWCKKQGIPTVFWNKEDPAHYDRFIDAAGDFDVVLTTDANGIGRYKQQLGHERVFAMPFAAQPMIHNPILTHRRAGKVCFAGAYYASRFEQRRQDMDCILKPSLEFGLDIYDRMHGAVGPGTEQYRFPGIYRQAIKGRLEYEQMLEAYRNYRVFLNVNSVKDSPTMCSRRVFELLACGTPVVSTPSAAIQGLLGNKTVRIVESQEQARASLQELLEDDNTWARTSALGLRKIMAEHTYSHRFRLLCKYAGLRLPAEKEAAVVVIVQGEELKSLSRLFDQIQRQSYKPCRIVVINTHNLEIEEIARTKSDRLGDEIDLVMISSAELPGYLEHLPSDTIVSIMSCRDYYGPQYLEDAVQAIVAWGQNIIGKATYFSTNNSASGVKLSYPGREHFMVDEIKAATLVARRSAVSANQIRRSMASQKLRISNAYASHRFNYLHLRDGCRLDEVPKSVLEQVAI